MLLMGIGRFIRHGRRIRGDHSSAPSLRYNRLDDARILEILLLEEVKTRDYVITPLGRENIG
jgi:hypothetical protein